MSGYGTPHAGRALRRPHAAKLRPPSHVVVRTRRSKELPLAFPDRGISSHIAKTEPSSPLTPLTGDNAWHRTSTDSRSPVTVSPARPKRNSAKRQRGWLSFLCCTKQQVEHDVQEDAKPSQEPPPYLGSSPDQPRDLRSPVQSLNSRSRSKLHSKRLSVVVPKKRRARDNITAPEPAMFVPQPLVNQPQPPQPPKPKPGAYRCRKCGSVFQSEVNADMHFFCRAKSRQ